VRGHLDAVDGVLLGVSGAREDGAGLAFEALAGGIEQAAAAEFGEQGRIAAAMAAWAYSSFDQFDLVAFPLQYGSDAGEGDQVEVIRVSPGDAPTLMPPQPAGGGDAAKHGGAGKVTGARVNHFGAFLDRLWRENDIMWGRLDAAEILIETMTPAHPGQEKQRAAVVERLRNQAFAAILNEELAREDIARLFPAAEEAEQAGTPVPDRLRRLIDAARSHPDDVAAAFRDAYRRPNQLPHEERLSDMGRAAHVAGGMMGGIARLRGEAKPPLPFAVAARLGRVTAGIVGAAVPSGRTHRRAELWFLALYVLGVVALAVGFPADASVLVKLGIGLLVLTGLANAVLWLVARRLGTGGLSSSPLWVTGAVALAAIVLGVLALAVLQVVRTAGDHPWGVAGSAVAVIAVGIGVALRRPAGGAPRSPGVRRVALVLVLLGVGWVLVLAGLELTHLGATHDWIPIFSGPPQQG
jgi:hypothetical protein